MAKSEADRRYNAREKALRENRPIPKWAELRAPGRKATRDATPSTEAELKRDLALTAIPAAIPQTIPAIAGGIGSRIAGDIAGLVVRDSAQPQPAAAIRDTDIAAPHGSDSERDSLVPWLAVPLLALGAAGGAVRLYMALADSWHWSAIAAAVVPLALEFAATHLLCRNWIAKRYVPALACLAVSIGALGLDLEIGRVAPALAAQARQQHIADDARSQLAKPVEIKTPGAASANVGRQGNLQLAQNAAAAIALAGKQAGELAKLTDRQLTDAKPVAGEEELTEMIAVGGSLCAMLLAPLLGELTRRRVLPVPAPEAVPPSGGGRMVLDGKPLVEAQAPRASVLERLARWPLVARMLGPRVPA